MNAFYFLLILISFSTHLSLAQSLWDKTYGGPASDGAISIIPTPDGGYFLTRESDSNAGFEKSQNNKSTWEEDDYWIVKIDALGNKQRDKSFAGHFSNDRLWSTIAISGGGYLLSEHSKGDTSFEKRDTNFCYFDYWVVRPTI